MQPSASYSITMWVRLPQRPGPFDQVASAIGETGVILGAIDLVGIVAAAADGARVARCAAARSVG